MNEEDLLTNTSDDIKPLLVRKIASLRSSLVAQKVLQDQSIDNISKLRAEISQILVLKDEKEQLLRDALTKLAKSNISIENNISEEKDSDSLYSRLIKLKVDYDQYKMTSELSIANLHKTNDNLNTDYQTVLNLYQNIKLELTATKDEISKMKTSLSSFEKNEIILNNNLNSITNSLSARNKSYDSIASMYAEQKQLNEILATRLNNYKKRMQSYELVIKEFNIIYYLTDFNIKNSKNYKAQLYIKKLPMTSELFLELEYNCENLILGDIESIAGINSLTHPHRFTITFTICNKPKIFLFESALKEDIIDTIKTFINASTNSNDAISSSFQFFKPVF